MSTLFQFREMYKRGNFVVLDTETTGLTEGEIIQIAIVDKNGVALLDTLIKPIEPIPAGATAIHRITDNDCINAPTWKQIVPTVKEVINGKDVVIYNAVYDRKMMHKSAERNGMEKVDWKVIAPFYCAMEAYAEFYGDYNDYHGSYRWQKLAVAAHRCGIPVVNAHSAFGDCLMTLGVMGEMCK